MRKPGYDSLLGQTPDGFVVLKEVGKGAASVVYQAMQPAVNNRLVALKVMDRTEQRLNDQAGDRNPFERDAAIAQLVRDPSIVRIYGTGQLSDGRYYVAMEFVDGMTIADEAAHRDRVPYREACDILLSVAHAVRALHLQHVVHRDLKPSNIMLRMGKDERLRVKLIDLGLARLGPERDDDRAPVHSSEIGTPQYMAPGQAAGEGTSFQTDVYALGAIFYELVCGQPHVVLDRPTPEGYLGYLRSNQPLPTMSVRAVAPRVPGELARFITRCVSRNRHERPADAVQFEQELAEIAAHLEPEREPSGSMVGRLRSAMRGLLGRGAR